MKVFPNPVYGTSEIIALIESDNRGTLTIYDINGKEVLKYQLIKGENHRMIASDNFEKGMYYFVLEDNEGIKDKKKIIFQ